MELAGIRRAAGGFAAHFPIGGPNTLCLAFVACSFWTPSTTRSTAIGWKTAIIENPFFSLSHGFFI